MAARRERAAQADVEVSGRRVGDVEGDILRVRAGSVLRGDARVREAWVSGTVIGDVHAEVVTILEGGCIQGEAVADRANVAGDFSGVLIAGAVLAKRTARIEGYVLSDSYGSEPGARFSAVLVSEPGASRDPARLDEARALTAAPPAPQAVQAEIPAVPTPVVVPFPVPPQVEPTLAVRAPEPAPAAPQPVAPVPVTPVPVAASAPAPVDAPVTAPAARPEPLPEPEPEFGHDSGPLEETPPPMPALAARRNAGASRPNPAKPVAGPLPALAFQVPASAPAAKAARGPAPKRAMPGRPSQGLPPVPAGIPFLIP